MMVLSIWSFGHTRRLWSVLSSPNCHVLAIEAKQSYSGNFFFVKTEMTFLFLDTYISNIWNDRLKSCLLPATTRWSICATESCVWSSGNPSLAVVNCQSIRIRAKIKVGCCRIGDLRDDNFILGTQVSLRTLKSQSSPSPKSTARYLQSFCAGESQRKERCFKRCKISKWVESLKHQMINVAWVRPQN